MSEKMKTITVLDYTEGLVYQYNTDKWNIDDEPIEFFLEEQGHDSNDCYWMVHEDATIYVK